MNFHPKVPKLSGAFVAVVLFAVALTVYANASAQTSPLPSWNDGPAKQAIVSFVNKVTDKSGPNYVEPEDRIATFDEDGTGRPSFICLGHFCSSPAA